MAVVFRENGGKDSNPQRKIGGEWRVLKPPAPNSGWPRFDRYEIRNGCIVPGRGATICGFHPWADYEELRRKNRVQPPYQFLLELAETVDPNHSTDGVAPEIGDAAISGVQKEHVLNWCSHWGLLGIWQTQTVAARFAPRWSDESDDRRALQVCITRLNGNLRNQ